MDFRHLPRLLFVALIIYVLSLVLYYVGFCSTYWYIFSFTSEHKVCFGLFKVCETNGQYEVCEYLVDSNNVQDWQKAGLALACLGLIWITAAGFLTYFGVKMDKRLLQFSGGALAAVGGLLGIIAGIVVLVKASNTYGHIMAFSVGWSAILFLIGCCFAIVSSVLQTLAMYQLQRSTGEAQRLLSG